MFSKSSDTKYTLRCPTSHPFCGDSKKSKTKRRGFFYINKGNWYYKCHNCGMAMSFSSFLEVFNGGTYSSYLKDIFEAKGIRRTRKRKSDKDFDFTTEAPKFKIITKLDLERCDEIEGLHLAARYLKSRKIPRNHWKLFYHTEGYKEFVNTIVPGKYPIVENDEPRLVIPFFDSTGKLIAFQGRSYKKNAILRYITIKVDESVPRIFGAERIDDNKQIYATEGAIDSLFIPNCLSFNGADIPPNVDPSKIISVYDNNPRNRQIIKAIDKAIDRGFRVVIFPKTLKSDDINKMILSGEVQIEDMLTFLQHNTYDGLRAKLELNKWRKI